MPGSSGGALWLDVSNGPRNLYHWISADSIAKAMQVRSHTRVEVRAVSDAVQVAIGGFTGPAQALAIEDRNGHSSQIIALAIPTADEFLALTAILSERNGAPTAIDRLGSFVRAIAVELYKPAPGKFSPPWRGAVPELHLGDLRRLLQGEQP